MSLSEHYGIRAQMKGKHIIDGESSGPNVLAEIVKESKLQVWDMGEKRPEQLAGYGYSATYRRTSTVVRWIPLTGKLGKTPGLRNGEQRREEKGY